jgi:hypothetical protein
VVYFLSAPVVSFYSALDNVVDSILKAAGWTFTKADAGILFDNKAGVITVSGIILEIHRDHLEEFRQAVETLGAAIRSEGMAVSVQANDTAKNHNRVHVLIGSKPL